MSYASPDQKAILGRLLMDIVHGEITDETVWLVDHLDRDDVPLPMGHLVGYVQGMNMDLDIRRSISRDLLDELRIITIEQMEALYPPEPEEEISTWQPDALIPDRAVVIITDLLLEILKGKISFQMLTAINDLDELGDIPQPYREIISLVQGSRGDGKEIAGFLLHILSSMIEELKKLR